MLMVLAMRVSGLMIGAMAKALSCALNFRLNFRLNFPFISLIFHSSTNEGARYDGGWKDDRPQGFGVLVLDVRRYEGEWRDGRKQVCFQVIFYFFFFLLL